MFQTVRSSMLKMLYPQRTDCIFEWISTILHEEESAEYEKLRSYFDDYLAYSEDHMYLMDYYYQNSLKAIRYLKRVTPELDHLVELYDDYMTSLAEKMEARDHESVEKILRAFFQACHQRKTA